MTKRATAVQAEQAIHSLEQADKLATRAPIDAFEATWNPREAARLRTKGEALLAPPSGLEGDGSLEIMAATRPGEAVTNAGLYLRDTLREPNIISVDASMQRSSLAMRADILTPALDAIKAADATSSIEKMICYQMAGVHEAGMNLLIRLREDATNHPQRCQQPGEIARLTNAVSRLFEVYQNAALVLQKLKTGGRQHVVVQHQQLVNVGPGGQAVVARTVRRSSRKRTSKREPK
jgi:hypothetical protein